MSFLLGTLPYFAKSLYANLIAPVPRISDYAKDIANLVQIKADPASLVVDDSGYQTAAQYFTRQGERYEEAIKAFVSILNEICSEGIISGDTADAMRAFAEYAGELKGTIGDVMKQASEQCTQFVSNVDSADQFLY